MTAPSIEVDFGKVHDHVQRVIAAIAPTDSAERFAGLGVRVIKGHAKFKDRRTVVVGDDYEIRARRFVIATGSTPALPPIPGLERVLISPTKPFSISPSCPTISSSSAPGRSAWKWRKRSAGSAAR